MKLKEDIWLLTGKELCYVLGISSLTLIKLRNLGLPVAKVKLRRLYDLDEVKEWLERRSCSAGDNKNGVYTL